MPARAHGMLAHRCNASSRVVRTPPVSCPLPRSNYQRNISKFGISSANHANHAHAPHPTSLTQRRGGGGLAGLRCSIPKAPSLNNYPYYAVLACVVASVVSWRWSKIHRREMWKLERELNARYDDVLRNLATFIPSDLACDAVIRQRVNKRLRPTEDEAQHVWLEPDVKVPAATPSPRGTASGPSRKRRPKACARLFFNNPFFLAG